jgi:lysozyme
MTSIPDAAIDSAVAPLLGFDISSHQDGINLDDAQKQGLKFVIIKASQGSFYTNPNYLLWAHEADRLGLIRWAYHWVTPESPESQWTRFRSVAPNVKCVMLDAEVDSLPSGPSYPTYDELLAVEDYFLSRLNPGGDVAAQNEHGMLYLPHWFWSAKSGNPSAAGWDSPDLSRVRSKHLVASNYVIGSGDPHTLYSQVSSSQWQGYGGRTPDLLQYTSSAAVGGKKSVDCDVSRLTLDKLRSFVAGVIPAP